MMQLLPWLCAALGMVMALWGITSWIPQLTELYRQRYYPEDLRPAVRRSYLWLLAITTLCVMFLIAMHTSILLLPALALIGVALAGVVWIDSRYLVIPDRLHLVGGIGVAAYLWLANPGWPASQWLEIGRGMAIPIALLILGAVYRVVRRREGMGLGDIKLLVWLGAWLGGNTLEAVAIAVGAAALVLAARYLKAKKRDASATAQLDQAFAFGPYLVAGCVFTYLWTLYY